ncbi:MAG: hypothetical protein JNL63_08465 [Bacteroidia bacterium]|nr:hypothetical protein [Bacteroidia bacterium]
MKNRKDLICPPKADTFSKWRKKTVKYFLNLKLKFFILNFEFDDKNGIHFFVASNLSFRSDASAHTTAATHISKDGRC